MEYEYKCKEIDSGCIKKTILEDLINSESEDGWEFVDSFVNDNKYVLTFRRKPNSHFSDDFFTNGSHFVDDSDDMKDFKFVYYVLRHDISKREIVRFNIFDNIEVNERCIKEVESYLKYKDRYISTELLINNVCSGFKGLVQEIRSIIKWQEWGRYEYEMSVSEPFPDERSKYKKIDCYYQIEPNLEALVREMLYQYKNYKEKQR